MKIYKDENLEVRFDLDSKVLEAKFLKEYMLLKEAAQFTGSIELISPKGVLMDFSQVKGMEKFAQDIFEDDLTMQLKGHGVRKFAFVRSPEEKVNQFIMGLFDHGQKPEKLDLKEFDNAADALVWLKG